MPRFIPAEKARAIIAAAGLAEVFTTPFSAFAWRTESRDTDDDRGGIRLRAIPDSESKDPRRKLYHEGDVRQLVAEVGEAHREGRQSDQAYQFAGEKWLPTGLATRGYGFSRFKLLAWASDGAVGANCPAIGRKLRSLRRLARSADGKWRRILFISDADLLTAKQAESLPSRVDLDPNEWADNAEAKRIAGVGSLSTLNKWRRHGYTAPTGTTIRLKRELGWRRGGRKAARNASAYWSKRDLLLIAKSRAAPDASVYEHETEGRLRREGFVKNQLGVTWGTLAIWSKGCWPLGGAKFRRFKIPRVLPGPHEWGYREDQFQKLLAMPPEQRVWKRRGGGAMPPLVDVGGVMYRRETDVKRFLSCSTRVLRMWAEEGCPALGGELLGRKKVTRPNCEDQNAFRDDQIQTLAKVPRELRTWGPTRRRPGWGIGWKDEPKPWLAPQQKPDTSTAALPASPKAKPKATPKANGRPWIKESRETQRLTIVAEWFRAKGAGVSQVDFCKDRGDGLTKEKLHSYIVWAKSPDRRKALAAMT